MKNVLLFFIMMVLIAGCAAPEKKTLDESVFYPPLPQTPKLQFLTSITSEEDLGKKQSFLDSFLFGDLPTVKKLLRPYDMGSVEDKIYVLDRKYKKLIVIDLKDKSFSMIKSKAGAFIEPSGIWVSDDNLKYVSDFKRKQVVVFDENDKFLRTYGKKGELDKPLDVAVYEDNVYVCDHNLHQIIVFDKTTGEITRKIGEQGKKEGELFKPTHITVDSQGNLFVNDAFNFRIQEFDPYGEYMQTIGFHGDSVGGFARPKGIAVSEEGHLYVVDTAFENVQIFDAETGRVALFFGGYGPKPGDMYMPSPVYVSRKNLKYFQKFADKDFRLIYLIYVGNSFGINALNVYGFGEWTGEKLPEIE